MLANSSVYLLQGSWLLAVEIQRRCFHVSPLAAAASKVAMSKFDKDTPLPYEKLLKNLEIVKKRYFYEVYFR
jgi:aconitate hydratase